MSIEVPCPNCRSVLRAPDEAAGRRVKCKKCEHRFRLPGAAEAPNAGAIEESQLLSVIDSVPPAPVVAAVVVPPPAGVVPTVVVPVGVPVAEAIPAIPVPTPATAADPGNPFAFSPNGAVVVGPDRTDDDDEDAPRGSRHRPARQKAGGGVGKVLLIVGVIAIVFLVGAGGAALGVYYLLVKPAVTKATAVIEAVPLPPVETKAEKSPDPKAATESTKPKDAGKTKPGGVGRQTRGKDKGGAATPDRSVVVPRTTAPAFQLPDPPAGAGKLIAPARDKLTLDVPTAQIKAVAFGGKNPRAVAVFWNMFGGFQGAGAKDAVDVYSVSTGRPSAHFELPADGISGPRGFDLSPDGNRVAVELPAGKLTVFDVDSKEKLLDGIDPFAGSPTPRAGMAGVKFVGSPDVVAVVDKAGAVDLWDVKSKARTASGRAAGASGGSPPALPDLAAQQLWLFAQGAVTEVSAQTADPGVSVTVADPAGAPLGVAIDATGRKGAAVFRDSGTAHGLAVLDLRPGKYTVTDKLALPEKAGVPSGVSLLGAGSVAAVQLADRSACLVFDAEHKVPAFYIKAASGPAVKHFGDADADRLWWALPDGADGKKSLLVSVDANFDDYQMLVAEAQSGKKPLYLTPRADGLAK